MQSTAHSVTADVPGPAQQSQPVAFALALLVGLALSTALLAPALTAQPLWLDEFHSLLNSAAHRAEFEGLPYDTILQSMPRCEQLTPDSSAAAVWRGLRDDTHPPLYFVVLNLWRRSLGDSASSWRWLSIICVALAQIPLALVVRRLAGDGAGLLAGLLGLWSHAALLAASQARPYALLLLTVNTSFWLLLRLRDVAPRPGPQRLGWAAAVVVVTAMALLTHYFAALAVCAQALFVAWCFPRGARRWAAAALALSVAVVAVIWLPSLLHQRPQLAAQDWLLEPDVDHVWRTVVRGAALPVRLLGGEIDGHWQQRSVLAAVLLLGLSGVALHLLLLWLLRRLGRRDVRLVVLWYGLPAAALIAVDLATGRALLAHLRYATVAAPAMAAIVVLAIQALPRRGRRAAVVVATLLMILGVQLPPRPHPDLSTAASTLQEWLDDDAIVVLQAQGWPEFWPRRLLGLLAHALPDYRGPACMLAAEPGPATAQHLAEHARIVVVSPRVEGPANPVPETHQPTYRSPYVWQVGWITVFEREAVSAPK